MHGQKISNLLINFWTVEFRNWKDKDKQASFCQLRHQQVRLYRMLRRSVSLRSVVECQVWLGKMVN